VNLWLAIAVKIWTTKVNRGNVGGNSLNRMSDTISCPECGTSIEITEALSTQLGDKLRKEFEAKQRERDREFSEKETSLKSQQSEIEKTKKTLDEEIGKRLNVEREKLRAEESEKARSLVLADIKEKDAELARIKEKLNQTQQAELEVRKKARELEEAKAEFDLTLSRTLDQERGKIRLAAKKEADDERSLKDAEKDKLIGDLKTQIDDLKRKSEQGSQQLQGEILELALEDLLRQHFQFDDISPVPKGIHGGDVVHTVRDAAGTVAGIILWESKRTKSWSDSWLPKLRDDQRAAKAQVSILVSIELPKDVPNFKNIDGVWVTSSACAVSVANALRIGLLEVASAKRSVEGRNDKMEHLFSYLAGAEFRHRIEGIVESFVTLKDELETEKRATQRMWAKREKQLERAITQTAGMYGDLDGIIGASLPRIEKLELPAIESKPSGSLDDQT
jgi:hypothetical protein